MEHNEETLELGGNIKLTGFSDLDSANMVVVKKMVGNYAKKMSESAKNFESLSVVLKKVHETEKSEKYELHAKLLDNGKAIVSEVTERNLFFALDKAMKNILSQLEQ